jgi:hypothetical protein
VQLLVKLVDRHCVLLASDVGVREDSVSRLSSGAEQQIIFGHKFETRRLYFALDDVLIDAMQALASTHHSRARAVVRPLRHGRQRRAVGAGLRYGFSGDYREWPTDGSA